MTKGWRALNTRKFDKGTIDFKSLKSVNELIPTHRYVEAVAFGRFGGLTDHLGKPSHGWDMPKRLWPLKWRATTINIWSGHSVW